MIAPTRGREVGQIFQKAVQVWELLLRQSPSQKSEISDSPLYTRGPLGVEEDGGVEVDGEVFALLRSDPSSVSCADTFPMGEGFGVRRKTEMLGDYRRG